MKRREFIKKTGATVAALAVSPYILPSGRLFAKSGVQLAEHVVFVMFAGGVRQQESVMQEYISTSQYLAFNGNPNVLNVSGNIMYNMLNDINGRPASKISYGIGIGGASPIPQILTNTLQSSGTFFPEMTALSTGHYVGNNQLLEGSMASSQGLKMKPLNPTIFEYARKHLNLPASKVWFIGNSLINSLPLLNYSLHPNYGPKYGANMLIPDVTFGNQGQEYLKNAKVYHPEDQLSPMYEMKAFLDNSYSNATSGLEVIGNTDVEKQQIKTFMKEMFNKTLNNSINKPPISSGKDMNNIGYALEVMKEFKPSLTVLNLGDVDSCHGDYTSYLSSLHRADHGVGYLWDQISSGALGNGMDASNTAIVIAPECGRNFNPNPIRDASNNYYCYDHSSENELFGNWEGRDRYNSRRVFGLMAGSGVPVGQKIGGFNSITGDYNPIGQTTDVVPTIAELLGFKDEVNAAGHLASGTQSLFDRM